MKGVLYMKKRTLLVSIISVFVMVSVTWAIPANVKAYEAEGKIILNELIKYSKSLSKDSDFQQLIDLHSNEKMENIFKQVLNAKNEQQINDLADQYLNLIDLEKMNEIIERLNQRYKTQLDILSLDINNLYNSKKDSYNLPIKECYYKITENEDGIRIVKLDTEESSEDTILIRGSDGAIKISDGEWIDHDALDKLKEFLNYLAVGGIIGSYVGIYVGMIGLALAELGLERIGYLIFRFGMRLGVFGLFISIYSYVLLMIIDVFEKILDKIDDDNAKQKNKSSKLIEILKNRRGKTSFFQSVIEKIVRYLQNINSNLNFN